MYRRSSGSRESFHFEFFGVRLAFSFHMALFPWILGMVPWFSLAPIHASGFPLALVVSLVGLRSDSRLVHLAIAVLTFVFTLLSFFLVPEIERSLVPLS